MARISFKTYRSYLGLPGARWSGTTAMCCRTCRPGARTCSRARGAGLRRLWRPHPRPRPAGDLYAGRLDPVPDAGGAALFRHDVQHRRLRPHPAHRLPAAGGRIVRAEFHEPSELAGLKEKVVINCPGYGARALVEGRVHHARARPDRLADPAAGGQLRVPVRARDHAAAPSNGIIIQMLEGGGCGIRRRRRTPSRARALEGWRGSPELYRADQDGLRRAGPRHLRREGLVR